MNPKTCMRATADSRECCLKSLAVSYASLFKFDALLPKQGIINMMPSQDVSNPHLQQSDCKEGRNERAGKAVGGPQGGLLQTNKHI
jgi:hypothetical protein